MSHFKERAEKVCLNCKAETHGPFCHKCGQENIEPKESVLHLVMHFFNDITHFDGKFFETLYLLVTRPGYLSLEYATGRRAAYLNPIRMYVFTSALFFLIFFSVVKPGDAIRINEPGDAKSTIVSLEKKQSTIKEFLTEETDSLEVLKLKQKLALVKADLALLKRDSTKLDSIQSNSKNINVFEETGSSGQSREQYDSLQNSLPPEQRDGFLTRTFKHKGFEINKKYDNNGRELLRNLVESFLHRLPQLMFVALPFFALLMKLLYYRRKEFYYVNHLIFSLHFFIFSYCITLLLFLVSKVKQWVHWGILDFLQLLIWLCIFFYLYKALRNFFRQGRAKTILKFLLLNFFFLVVLGLLFGLFFFYSLFQL